MEYVAMQVCSQDSSGSIAEIDVQDMGCLCEGRRL